MDRLTLSRLKFWKRKEAHFTNVTLKISKIIPSLIIALLAGLWFLTNPYKARFARIASPLTSCYSKHVEAS